MVVLYALIGKSICCNPNQTLISIIEDKDTADKILKILKDYQSTRPIYCGIDTADAKEHYERLTDWSKHHPVFDSKVKSSFTRITTVFDDYEIVECGLIQNDLVDGNI